MPNGNSKFAAFSVFFTLASQARNVSKFLPVAHRVCINLNLQQKLGWTYPPQSIPWLLATPRQLP